MINVQTSPCFAILVITNSLQESWIILTNLSDIWSLQQACELVTKSLEVISMGRVLCLLPYCGVEIKLEMCTETGLKLKASIHSVNLRHAGSGAGMRSFTLQAWSANATSCCCALLCVSVANEPPVFFSLSDRPEIYFSDKTFVSPLLFHHCCAYEEVLLWIFFVSQFLLSDMVTLCQFAASDLESLKVKLEHIMLLGCRVWCRCFTEGQTKKQKRNRVFECR